jgi:hypothetical protein
MDRRYLALWLPLLPPDRLRRLEPALVGQPLATWATAAPLSRPMAPPSTWIRPWPTPRPPALPLCCVRSLERLALRALTLRAFRGDGMVQDLAIGTGAPSREPSHLRYLFRDVLEQLEPDLGFERLTLEAHATDPLDGIQAVLRGESGWGGLNQAVLLAELIDRLSQRIGCGRWTATGRSA